MAQIDLYQPERDEAGVLDCWRSAFAELWPLAPDMLRVMTHAEGPNVAGPHFVARANNQVVGVVITQFGQPPRTPGRRSGHIAALAVARSQQRMGIGRALLHTAIDAFREADVKVAQIGGLVPRLFPGVPMNMSGALDFFRKQGWEFEDTTWDIARSLTDYETPAEITARIAAEGLTIDAARADEVEEALDFERREFPGWLEEHGYPARIGDHADILVARDPAKGVVGTLIMYVYGQSSPKRGDFLWHTLLGPRTGSLNAVGVAASERGRGIGVGLVARGSEVLKARGVENAGIGWTTLTGFYGKLGYQPWREYAASWREIG